MAKIKQIQKGNYTVFRQEDLMQNDLLVRPAPCRGAEVIMLSSFFMDYGHVVQTFDISEEMYIKLQQAKTTEDVDAVLLEVRIPS